MTRSAANITNRIASPRILRKYYGSHIADVKRFTMPTTHPPPFAPRGWMSELPQSATPPERNMTARRRYISLCGELAPGNCFGNSGLNDGDHAQECCHAPSSWPATPLYRPDYPDQQDRADEAGNQVAEPSPKDDPEETQYGASNRRTDNTKDDIHHHPHVALHELLCQPACNPTDDDGCDPADTRIFHGSPPRKGAPLPDSNPLA